MADTRKIVVELKVAGDGVDSDDGAKVNVENSVDPMKSSGKNSELGRTVLINSAYRRAKDSVINLTLWSINRYIDLKEDYMAENGLNIIKTTISKASSFGTTVAAGAVMGGWVGAAVAGIGWAGNEAISQAKRYESYYRALNEQNVGLEFGSIRAGLINGGRGTEN